MQEKFKEFLLYGVEQTRIILNGHDQLAHRTYGPDAVGVIGRRAVASLWDAYVVESIHS